jgi:hypothetical protein
MKFKAQSSKLKRSSKGKAPNRADRRLPVLSVAPGFSPVNCGAESLSRFSGFSRWQRPLKRLKRSLAPFTGLKPGVNTENRVTRCRWSLERFLSFEL